MTRTMERRGRWIVPAAFVLLSVASIAPIQSHDYFWHLAAGRWMAEHHALPLTDPFGLASTRAPWIDGEWLFQLLIYPLYQLGGHAGVSIALGIGMAALFTAILAAVARETSWSIALPIVLVAWYGAGPWLRERPSTAGAACLAALLMVLIRGSGPWRSIGLFAVTVSWINLHPSALLAPAVVAIYEISEWLSRLSRAAAPPPQDVVVKRGPDWRSILATAAALLVNPYGINAITTPLRLTQVVHEFHNQEWEASTPAEDPLLYLVIGACIATYLLGRRAQWPRALVLLFLAILAIRFCRNQGLFFVAAPLLAGGLIPADVRPRVPRIAAIAAVVAFLAILANTHISPGVDERKFPVRAVARLRDSGLQGNIYDSYGLGGFLIWNFFPQRRIVTDGRNELYVAYNREHERALRDGRVWRTLFAQYDLRLAVFEYRQPPMQIIDPRTHRIVLVPAFAAYFPRRRWALIAIDPVAMVFARRDAFPPARIAQLELQ